MNAWQFWTTEIAKKLSDALDVPVSANELVVPPDASLGDFAFGCFKLAKEKKTNPIELAKQLAEKVGGQAAGPYVNFLLPIGETVGHVVTDIETAGDAYGQSVETKKENVLLEYAQPNTHKEIHVGHLRNLVLGNALVNLLRATGLSVTPVSYHGDIGAHVAKCLWELKTQNADVKNQNGKFLGEMYAAATKRLDEHPELKDEVSLVQQKLEAHDPAWEKLWIETRQWSLDEMKTIFDELGTKIERQYLESEVVDRGQQMVDKLIKNGIAKESQGAIIVDLEEVKLGVFLVRKSDGTSLYSTKDLALAELKAKEYPDVERSLMLVDSRQSFYFKQLFEVFRRMGFSQSFEFIGYEFVTLKEGAMSSRDGNIVTYESFRDAVVAYARAEIEKRHVDWPEKKTATVAHAIAMSGIKFGMLKQDNDKILTFDLQQALSFDGATGPYCQYAATRLGSILKKAVGAGPRARPPADGQAHPRGGQTHGSAPTGFDHPSEKNLAMILAQFPERVSVAAKELRPSVIAQWCFETSQRINDFYRDVPVLESTGDLLEGRLRLIATARQVLMQGLELLGIDVPEEM